jgi:hypothetical protein
MSEKKKYSLEYYIPFSIEAIDEVEALELTSKELAEKIRNKDIPFNYRFVNDIIEPIIVKKKRGFNWLKNRKK